MILFFSLCIKFYYAREIKTIKINLAENLQAQREEENKRDLEKSNLAKSQGWDNIQSRNFPTLWASQFNDSFLFKENFHCLGVDHFTVRVFVSQNPRPDNIKRLRIIVKKIPLLSDRWYLKSFSIVFKLQLPSNFVKKRLKKVYLRVFTINYKLMLKLLHLAHSRFLSMNLISS